MSENVRAFLIEHGVIPEYQAPSPSGEFNIVCPQCHNEKAKCFINAHGNGVKCFHCSYAMSWRKYQRNFVPATIQEETMEWYINECQRTLRSDPYLLDWFRNRGIADETITSQRFGYCSGLVIADEPQRAVLEELKLVWPSTGVFVLRDRITIPYFTDGIATTVRGRSHPDTNSDKKYLSLPHSAAQPYIPRGRNDPNQPVVVCEGELDATILAQNGAQSIGVPGATSVDPKWLREYKTIYAALDGDAAGREGLDALIKHTAEIRRVDLPEGVDVSEYVSNYGYDSFKLLLDQSVLYLYGKPQKEDRWAALVDSYNDWAWSNGELLGSTIPGWPRLQEYFSGWSDGLILMGAEAHSGKSCFLVRAALDCAQQNPNTVVAHLSLDDSMEETMRRYVSLESQIDFVLISSPRYNFDHPDDPLRQNKAMLDHYNEALVRLKGVDNLILRDATYGRSLRYVRSFFERLRNANPDKKLFVILDSLAKLTQEGGPDDEDMGVKSNWKAYVASELKYLTTKHKICLIVPTDLRKLNGTRRPQMDDLKDAAELAYEATTIMLGYNDVKRVGAMNALLKWTGPEDTTEPILEWNIIKNKFTGKSPVTVRYRMLGAISEFWELTQDEDTEWDYRVRDQAHEQTRRTF